jgi:hypothetical protein
MLGSIWNAIGLGQSVVKTISALKRDVESVRPPNPEAVSPSATQMEALDKQIEAMGKRTSDLEIIVQAQENRFRQIEKSLNDAVSATEAVAQRASTIFWIGAVSCALSVSALTISIIALVVHK